MAAERVAKAPQVGEEQRVLVHEERQAAADQHVTARERARWTRHGEPGRGRERRLRMAEAEEEEQRLLGVTVPPWLEVAGLRLPAHRQSQRVRARPAVGQ